MIHEDLRTTGLALMAQAEQADARIEDESRNIAVLAASYPDAFAAGKSITLPMSVQDDLAGTAGRYFVPTVSMQAGFGGCFLSGDEAEEFEHTSEGLDYHLVRESTPYSKLDPLYRVEVHRQSKQLAADLLNQFQPR